MEIRKLRYFVVAAEEENFHRAAARLFIAQPALTRHIKDLEQEVGVGLFERNKRRVRLSVAGQSFLQHARAMVEQSESAVQEMRRFAQGSAGRFRVSLIPTALYHPPVSAALRQFQDRHAGADLDLHLIGTRPACEALRAGRIDAAFVHRDQRTRFPGLSTIEVAKLHWVMMLPAGHALARRRTVRLADFQGENLIWIPREQSPESYDELIPQCIEAGLKLKILHNSGDFRMYMGLVEAGMGVTFTASSIAENASLANVVFRRVEEFSSPFFVNLVWRESDPSPLLEDFLDRVKDLIVPMPAVRGRKSCGGRGAGLDG